MRRGAGVPASARHALSFQGEAAGGLRLKPEPGAFRATDQNVP
jgi:hypothetical protein